MITMTVRAIIHDLAIIHVVKMTYLPEDDTAITRHSQAIAKGGMVHLLLGEIAHRDYRATEGTANREVTLHHIAFGIENQVMAGILGDLGIDLREQVPEGIGVEFAELHAG